MTSKNTPKSELMEMRNRRLREIVDASDRATREKLLGEFFALERAIAVIEPESVAQKYGAYKRAIDAILDYLDEVGRGVTEMDIADTVTARGFRAPSPAARSIVLKSIASYLYGEAGRKRQVIKRVGDLIGRGEWGEERFK